jgi:hypothetical protein
VRGLAERDEARPVLGLPLLAQLAQFEGDFANFADSPASRINGLAAVCGRIGRVVATKAIPFCRGV